MLTGLCCTGALLILCWFLLYRCSASVVSPAFLKKQPAVGFGSCPGHVGETTAPKCNGSFISERTSTRNDFEAFSQSESETNSPKSQGFKNAEMHATTGHLNLTLKTRAQDIWLR